MCKNCCNIYEWNSIELSERVMYLNIGQFFNLILKNNNCYYISTAINVVLFFPGYTFSLIKNLLYVIGKGTILIENKEE